MKPTAWLTLFVFICTVIFSVIMAIISPGFRVTWNLTKPWTYVMFYVIISVMALLLTVGTHCSITGKDNSPICGAYSWVLTIMVLAMFALFLTNGIVVHLEEKKEHIVIKPTTKRVDPEST